MHREKTNYLFLLVDGSVKRHDERLGGLPGRRDPETRSLVES